MTSTKRSFKISQKLQQTVNGIFGNSIRNDSSKKVEPRNAVLPQPISQQSQHSQDQRSRSPKSRKTSQKHNVRVLGNQQSSSIPQLFVRHQRSRVSPAVRRMSERASAHSHGADHKVPNEALMREPLESMQLLNSKKMHPDVPTVVDDHCVAAMYDIFLRFNADSEGAQSLHIPVHELDTEYRQFKFMDSNLVIGGVVVCLMTGVLFFDICGTWGIGQTGQEPSLAYADVAPIDIASLVAGVATVVLFLVAWTPRVLRHRERRAAAHKPSPSLTPTPTQQPPTPIPAPDTSPTHLGRWSAVLDPAVSSAGRTVGDGWVVFLVLFAGLVALSRTLRSPCEGGGTGQEPIGVPAADGWATGVGCATQRMPMENYALCLVVVLLPQVFCKGVSRTAICLSWAISVILINLSLFYARSTAYTWTRTNVNYLFVMLISYALERRDLQTFLRSKILHHTYAARVRQDIALAKELLRDSRQQVDEGRRQLDAKRSMVRHVSHEIRTPMNITAVGLDLVVTVVKELGDQAPPFLLSTVEACQSSCNSSLEVLNELMDFEKLAGGMFTVDRVPTLLVPFLTEVADMFQLSARAKHITLLLVPWTAGDGSGSTIGSGAGAGTVASTDFLALLSTSIDVVKMKTVFRNLLSNAIKFSPAGGSITVTVTPYAESGEDEAHVVVSVKDSGAGMTAANLLLLFQEGVQFNANTLQGGGGSGFGLYISKGIVMLHEGEIWAESEGEGCGSTFFVKLPLTRERLAIPAYTSGSLLRGQEGMGWSSFMTSSVVGGAAGSGAGMGRGSVGVGETEAAARAASIVEAGADAARRAGGAADRTDEEAAVAAQVDQPRLHILVVDDSDMTRKMVMRKMCSLGHTCVEAADGVQAVSMVLQSLVGSNLPSGKFDLSRVDERSKSASSRAPPVSTASATGRSTIDLVLMDNNMPLMTGADATFEMRRWGYKGVIVAVSGDTNDEEFFDAGADAFLQKPLNQKRLDRIIGEHFTVGENGATYNKKHGQTVVRLPSVPELVTFPTKGDVGSGESKIVEERLGGWRDGGLGGDIVEVGLGSGIGSGDGSDDGCVYDCDYDGTTDDVREGDQVDRWLSGVSTVE